MAAYRVMMLFVFPAAPSQRGGAPVHLGHHIAPVSVDATLAVARVPPDRAPAPGHYEALVCWQDGAWDEGNRRWPRGSYPVLRGPADGCVDHVLSYADQQMAVWIMSCPTRTRGSPLQILP